MTASPGSLPYPGLRPFRQNEGHLFYGRRRHINDLLERLINTQTVFVIGPSGCGKSSLVRPGLYDTLLAGNFPRTTRDWRFVYARPGNDPVQALAAGINASGAIDVDRERFDLATLLYERNALAELLKECPLPGNRNLLLLIDQFEEIFSEENSDNKDELIRFVRIITDFTRDTPERTYMVITMRSDYIGDCTAFDGLAEVINDTHYLVPPLNDDELIEAIASPSEDLGADIQDSLKRRLMDDAHLEKRANFERGYDILPLVQHTVQRVWIAACAAQGIDPHADYRNLTDAHVGLAITEDQYFQIGPLAQALGRHADEILDGLLQATGSARSSVEHITEIMFKRLTHCTTAGKFVRAPTTRANLLELCADSGIDQSSTAELPRLVEHILSVFSDDTVCFIRTGGSETNDRVDIGHESLIRQWEKLRGWARNEARAADFYKLLVENSQEWESPDDLLHGTRLQRARDWRGDPRYSRVWAERYGSEGEFDRVVDFLESSEARHEKLQRAALARERELKKTRKAKKRGRQQRVAAGIFIVLLAMISWTGYSTWQRNVELRRSIATTAAALPDSQGLVKALLVREMKDRKNPPPQAIKAAHDAAVRLLPAVRYDRAHSEWVWDVAFTPDGQSVLSVGDDGRVNICSSDASAACRELERHESPLYAVAVSADGRFAAAGGRSGVISVFDLHNDDLKSEIGSYPSIAWDIGFSPDDRWIVSGHDDGTIKRWSLGSENSAVELGRSDKKILSIVVDPRGRWVATAGTGSRIELWDLAGHGLIARRRIDGVVNGLTVNQSGSRIGFGTTQGDVGIWDRIDDTIINVGAGQDLVYRVDFAPRDDHRIVSGHKDGWRLWQAGDPTSEASWSPSDRWQQTGTTVLSVKFDSSGRQLVSGNSTGAVSVWRLDGETEPITVGIGGATPDCGFVSRIRAGRSPDARPIATYVCRNGQVGQVNLDAEPNPIRVAMVNSNFLAVDLSDTGNVVVTGDAAGEVTLWRFDEDDRGRRLGQHRCEDQDDQPCSVAVRAVALAPDSASVASATQSGEIMLWSLQDGAPRRLGVHPSGFALIAVSPVVFDPSGGYVASGSEDGTIHIWPVQGTDEVQQLGDGSGGMSAVLNLSFSPDGERLASTHANGDVRIWPRSSEGGDFLVGRQDGLLNAVGFSPDGRQVASANSAGVARIWDIESRVEVFKLAGHLDDEPMLSLDYLNDSVDTNHRLVTAQGDIVQIWRPDWPALIAYLSGNTRACLSVAEREIYLTEDRKDARRKAQGCKLVDAAD